MDRTLILEHGGTILADGEPRSVFARKAKTLREYGIWIPQVTEWALKLSDARIDERNLPLTAADVISLYEKGIVSREDLQRRGRNSFVLESAPPAVGVRALDFSYPRSERPALDGATLRVPQGSLFTLALVIGEESCPALQCCA